MQIRSFAKILGLVDELFVCNDVLNNDLEIVNSTFDSRYKKNRKCEDQKFLRRC